MANIVEVPTKNVGDVFTSTMWNESIRDNINAGIVDQIGCQVKRVGDKTIADSSNVAIDFTDPADLDTDGMWDSANPTRITIQTAGVYAVTGHVQFAASGTGARHAWLLLNGATTIARDSRNPIGGTTVDYLTPNVVRHFNVGDYIELYARQSSGAGLAASSNAETGNYLRAFRL